MKKKLTNSDRIVLGSILPPTGNYENLICVRDIKKKIEPTQKEIQEWGVKSISIGQQNHITFNPSKKLYEIEFSGIEISIIKATLDELNNSKKLDESNINLYEIFCR